MVKGENKMKPKLLMMVLIVFLAISFGSACASKSESEVNDQTNVSSDFPIETIEANFNEEAFAKKYPDYQVAFEKTEGMEAVSITNHDPHDLKNLPNYQELIEYGYVSLESSDKIVYSIDIFIADTGSYYSAEYDAETKELLTEEGDWKPEGDLETFVAERLAMIDEIIQ